MEGELKEMNKRMILPFLGVLCITVQISALAEDENGMAIGEYISLGTYEGEPIIWRCIDEDNNGKLMLSDKILCYKAFDAKNHIGVSVDSERSGCGFWEESTLRAWLNSTETGGNIYWPGQNPPTKSNTFYAYDQEDGFLSETNFSKEDLSVIKSVTQWQILGVDELDKSTNGIYFPFNWSFYPDRAYWKERDLYTNISELSHIEGAMYRLSDTVFLLNESQVYNLYNNFGTAKAELTEYALSQLKDDYPFEKSKWWLRTGERTVAQTIYGEDGYTSNVCKAALATGVRPAFYLNEDAMNIISGNGTNEDPYIVEGKDDKTGDIEVFSNGTRLDFDTEPIIENDNTLVGMRAIFEAFGAEVSWNQDTLTAEAKKDDKTIELQINSNVMTVNNEDVQLETPVRLINDSTMIPLRAVSEALDATVDWIDDLKRVVIDKLELPMDFGEGKGKENWQTGQFGDWKPDMDKYRGGYEEYVKQQNKGEI
jgi:hypothetical protein